jgi:signal transduction histidine kinase
MTPTSGPNPLNKGIITLCLLVFVAWVDYLTGLEHTMFLFYLAPVLYVWGWGGRRAALAMAGLCAVVWLLVNLAGKQPVTDWATMAWETVTRLAVFLLIIILFTNRQELQNQVLQKTEKLHQEIQQRIRLEKILLEIAEGERRRIGRDLHDSLGQHLTAIAMSGKVVADKLAAKSAAESTEVAHLVRMVEDAIEMTRKLAQSLHPLDIQSDGLPDALKNLARNVTKTSGIDCQFTLSGSQRPVETEINVHLYRIAQEAVNNAIRHSGAATVLIDLNNSNEKTSLTITDNGCGLSIDPESNSGMGLRIMEYRARIIGAAFCIKDQPDGGTQVSCVLTLPNLNEKPPPPKIKRRASDHREPRTAPGKLTLKP